MQRDLLEIERRLWQKGVERIVGVDEVGRGPLAGPVVAAAVLFPQGTLIEGVDDSKKLTERRRDELFEKIMERALAVGVGIASHKEIDRINIYHASVLAMRRAIERVGIVPQIVLADGNSFRHESLRFENIVGGDARSFTIAAASIIAKVTRDRMMREYDARYPLYGFARHKGYSTPQHREAIRRYGLCEIHRRSFRLRTQ